jgi:thiamine-phosphate pyrophosphorylase
MNKEYILNKGGLYALTDIQSMGEARFIEKATQALAGGVGVLQYRDKSQNKSKRRQQAEALQALCASYQVPLIINDDVALAREVGAAGVHLGRDDGSIAAARVILGEQAIIGVSCYNQLDLADTAVAAGADYIAFGSVYASPSKPDAPRADLAIFQQAKAVFNMPVVAIGGIHANNVQAVFNAGADWIAVISALWSEDDVKQQATMLASQKSYLNRVKP